MIRSMPYPPNFKRTAARIIDPATGASTWALGSHRWNRNKGSFTINAMFIISHNVIEYDGNEWIEKNILLTLLLNWVAIAINRGSLAVIVYNIRKSPAWRRSGWYPHFIIINSVGIKEASNII